MVRMRYSGNLILSLSIVGFELITFAFVLLVSCYLITPKTVRIIIPNTQSFEYQYLRRNQERNETSFGRVTIPEIIGPSDYIFYEYGENDLVLVSNFGDEEYECSGNCVCTSSEDDSGRTGRKSIGSQALTRGVSYLLVAVSSLLAYEKSKSYIEQRCIEELSGDCHYESIQSSVDDCFPVLNERYDDNDLENQENNEEEERRVYFCYGNCVRKANFVGGGVEKQFENLKCEKLKKEGLVVVRKGDLIQKSELTSTSDKFRLTARNKFQQRHLTEFCKKNSRMEYMYETYFFYNGKKVPFKRQKSGFGCVGFGKREIVRCRQLDPEPSNNSGQYQEKMFWEKKDQWDKM